MNVWSDGRSTPGGLSTAALLARLPLPPPPAPPVLVKGAACDSDGPPPRPIQLRIPRPRSNHSACMLQYYRALSMYRELCMLAAADGLGWEEP